MGILLKVHAISAHESVYLFFGKLFRCFYVHESTGAHFCSHMCACEGTCVV